ncbi:uncharacterized protein LOC110627609 [Manihot esculenta]|uniref:uncharacterized protein LOC110627609 n=1 Tax=Manihot esculenta TaxID=3983 RepID=UPI000B5D6AA4|nr:uncharacterized protein LOC110627609 [Manihot esculenta]
MAQDESLFVSMDKSVKATVKMENGENGSCCWQGSEFTECCSNDKKKKDIPCLSKTLHAIFMTNNSNVVEVRIIGNSFPLMSCDAAESACKVIVDESWLWHKRYGHYNLNSLKFMQSHDMIIDMSVVSICDGVCSNYQFGKWHEHSFPKDQVRRAIEKLEIVYTNMCGPMSVPSLSQNKYFILFINDLTRMTWVYFLSSKSQVFNVFKKFKTLIEKQSGCVLKTLRSDNGKEYTSKEFDKFYEDASIQHQLSVPFPTRAVEGKTPTEAWFGSKPSASQLKVFRSVCYMLVPDVKRIKLDNKADLGIFLGYETSSKGYKIYNVKTKKVVISRDVKFDEGVYWDFEKEQIVRAAKSLQPKEYNFDNEEHVSKFKSLSKIYERCNMVVAEPSCYEEASQVKEWQHAMKEEIAEIEKNGTWELTSKPKGLDYGDTFALVARHNTIRLLLSLAAQNGWQMFHLDVKSALLNGLLNEEIYVRFRRSENEPTLYVNIVGDESQLIVSLYTDDILVTGGNSQLLDDFKLKMQSEFEMSDLGVMSYFLGLEIKQDADCLSYPLLLLILMFLLILVLGGLWDSMVAECAAPATPSCSPCGPFWPQICPDDLILLAESLEVASMAAALAVGLLGLEGPLTGFLPGCLLVAVQQELFEKKKNCHGKGRIEY